MVHPASEAAARGLWDTAALRRELATLADRLTAAETARDEQTARAATAVKDAETARATAHAAELLAAEAQATARTLREILDTITARQDAAGADS